MNVESLEPERTPSGRVRLREIAFANEDFADDVCRGLRASPKSLNPRYFYDELGSILFDAICKLPEYYVARAEDEILSRDSSKILDAIGRRVRLVELGSGAARKTRHIIEALLGRQDTLTYVPIDIERGALAAAASRLTTEFERLSVMGLVTTFENGIAQLTNLARNLDEPTLVLFLGSTIGNLEEPAQHELLHILRSSLNRGDRILLGADAVMNEEVLLRAYDDALGVTAAFNRNILVRINRELGGTFDLATFKHAVRFDAERRRVEMHLVSTAAQQVRLTAADLDVQFATGESIHTESSYKFTPAMIQALVNSEELEVERSWADAGETFHEYLLRVP